MYEVIYTPLETFGGTLESDSTIVLEPARSVNLTGLEEYVNYTISVQSYTRVGVGPGSEDISLFTKKEGMNYNNTILTIICISGTKYFCWF